MPRASTQSPVSPLGASTSTPRPLSPHRTEAAQPASDSDVVMKILESVARDHAEKAAKEERVLPLNRFVPAPVSIESTESQTNQSAIWKPLASVHPRQPSIPTIPLIPQEKYPQPLPPSANSMSSSPSPFPSTHSMASTTAQPLSALNNQNFRETTANGSHAGSSVPSISRSIAVPLQEVDMDNTPQLPRTEKAGDVPIVPLENAQTDDYVSRPAIQRTSSVCAMTSNAEVSIRPLDLDDSSQVVQSPPQSIEYSSVARKRHRDEDVDDEIVEVTTFKSLKTGEGLSGGLVVRKVVSMVRDTLTGLNDLLEIAAERELIPSEKAGAVGKAKAQAAETLSRDESPISAPSLSSPIVRSPFFSHSLVESSEVARLNEELLRMKAEMAQLKEQKARETPAEGGFMGTMRTELEILREQLRVLKEVKGSEMGTSEVQAMRNEILTLKTEMRSLLSPSNRSSGGPTTPSTPNLSFRFNNHAMSHTIHPLAHLLAIESDTVPSTPTTASTVEVGQNEGDLTRLSQKSRVQFDDESRSNRTLAVSRTPAVFDDLPIPVKSKRKSRMFFSRS